MSKHTVITFFMEADYTEALNILSVNVIPTASLIFFGLAMLYVTYGFVWHMIQLSHQRIYKVIKHVAGHLFLLAMFIVTTVMFTVVITYDMTMLDFLDEIWIDLHLYIPMILASLSYILVTHHHITDIKEMTKILNVVELVSKDNDVLRERLHKSTTALHNAEDKVMNIPKCETNFDVVKRWLS